MMSDDKKNDLELELELDDLDDYLDDDLDDPLFLDEEALLEEEFQPEPPHALHEPKDNVETQAPSSAPQSYFSDFRQPSSLSQTTPQQVTAPDLTNFVAPQNLYTETDEFLSDADTSASHDDFINDFEEFNDSETQYDEDDFEDSYHESDDAQADAPATATDYSANKTFLQNHLNKLIIGGGVFAGLIIFLVQFGGLGQTQKTNSDLGQPTINATAQDNTPIVMDTIPQETQTNPAVTGQPVDQANVPPQNQQQDDILAQTGDIESSLAFEDQQPKTDAPALPAINDVENVETLNAVPTNPSSFEQKQKKITFVDKNVPLSNDEQTKPTKQEVAETSAVPADLINQLNQDIDHKISKITSDFDQRVLSIENKIKSQPSSPAPQTPDSINPAIDPESVAKMQAKIDQMEKLVDSLQQKITALETTPQSTPQTPSTNPMPIQKIEAAPEEVSKEEKSIKPEKAPVEKIEKKTVKKPSAKQKKPKNSAPKPEPKAKKWTLKSIQPGNALIAPKDKPDQLVRVTVGATIPSLGKIEKIGLVNGKWTVQGTKGSLTEQ
jgi:hypothetical protein